MILRPLFLALALLAAAVAPAAAQQLPEHYRALLRDAAEFEDGAHFVSAVLLVARNADGGADAVIAALEEDSPDLAAEARDILVADLAAAGAAPAPQAAGAAPAPSPEAATTTPAGQAARRRGLLAGIGSALFGTRDDPVWSGRLRAGLRLDSGNRDQKDYTFGLEAERALIGWGFRTELEYSYSEANDRVSRDDLKAEARAERELGERWTTFVRTEFEQDRLSSYEYSTFAGAGFGYRLFETPAFNWTVRLAPGVRYRQPEDRDGATSLAGDLSTDLSWRIDDRLSLTSRTTVIMGEAGQLEEVLGLTAGIAGGWATEARYRYRYDFDPLPGFQRTERRLDVSLVKEF